ncbi:MAG TPA: hypothetical protein PLP21_02230 [Pyrinomonadaceae bacterium]|nr:hypothetical protein [Pyrinomonadaceae bacterium]
MPKLYACIISPDSSRDKAALVGLARQFAHTIEVIEDGILFDVSGLERLIGKPDRVAQKILGQMQKQDVAGNVAVADTVDTAMLLARCTSPRVSKGDTSNVRKSPLLTRGLVQPNIFEQLPLADLEIERDTLNVFNELGIRTVKDLLAVPQNDLVGRYGKSFQDVIDVLEQKGRSFVTPNIKENSAAWKFDLDSAVEDFEQLIFVVNHGLERLFAEVSHHGFSTEQLDISFRLSNKGTRDYEIKTSFPTLERVFWLKLINLRISLDPPEATIVGVSVVSHFTKPRPDQRGLYAVSRPEPESLLLTVNKLKKLVGEDNVGVPVLLNQRLAMPFKLDAEAMPDVRRETGSDRALSAENKSGTIALTYFRPPVRAEVLVREGRLVFVKTHLFSGHVIKYSGMWRANSHWWDRSWRTHEWDIELENNGVYRLCKVDKEWFVSGEYD